MRSRTVVNERCAPVRTPLDMANHESQTNAPMAISGPQAACSPVIIRRIVSSPTTRMIVR